MVPGVHRVERAYPHDFLDFRKRLALQFETDQLAATVAQLRHGLREAVEHFLALHIVRRVGIQVRQRDIRHRDLAIFAPPRRLAAITHDLVPDDLQR